MTCASPPSAASEHHGRSGRRLVVRAVSTAMTAISLSPKWLSTSGAMVSPTTTARRLGDVLRAKRSGNPRARQHGGLGLLRTGSRGLRSRGARSASDRDRCPRRSRRRSYGEPRSRVVRASCALAMVELLWAEWLREDVHRAVLLGAHLSARARSTGKTHRASRGLERRPAGCSRASRARMHNQGRPFMISPARSVTRSSRTTPRASTTLGLPDSLPPQHWRIR
jgi:hypothetical protein